jgi:hypothetical protein
MYCPRCSKAYQAERDLRPTVIARKVSFGSQSDAGAKTRGILMSVLVTLKKRGFDVTTRLKEVLDEIARNPTQNLLPTPVSKSRSVSCARPALGFTR